MATGQPDGIFRHLRRVALLHGGVGLTDGELLEGYLTKQDEAAFESLLLRHGPMVLGVCRRVLRNEADAHDAFQATFLVFLRKAPSISRRQEVGNWLYGVARKTALKAEALNRRRRVKEAQARRVPWTTPPDEDGDDLRIRLDEALTRLPDKYRAAVVLCDLEGKPLKEAARLLGCPLGTVASRLVRARGLLVRRLGRSGVSLSSVALASALGQNLASGSVPSGLVVSTLKAATSVAAGRSASRGALAPRVADLMEGVMRAMVRTKLQTLTAALLAVALLVGGGGLLAYRTLGAEDKKAATEAAKDDKTKSDKEKLQGTWTATSGEKNGEKLSEEALLKAWEKLIFADETVTREGKERREGKFTVDPEKKPKEIDLFTDVNTWKGIYELKGDVLKLALKFGNERPTEFDSTAGFLIVFKKEK
jgi:RNA polymerase sigma-70 factor (ECF subfamily)